MVTIFIFTYSIWYSNNPHLYTAFILFVVLQSIWKIFHIFMTTYIRKIPKGTVARESILTFSSYSECQTRVKFFCFWGYSAILQNIHGSVTFKFFKLRVFINHYLPSTIAQHFHLLRCEVIS
jgi:hypothetical protein